MAKQAIIVPHLILIILSNLWISVVKEQGAEGSDNGWSIKIWKGKAEGFTTNTSVRAEK